MRIAVLLLLGTLCLGGSELQCDSALGCCKVCTTGKACGDSCISWDKTCNVGPGCACNG